MSEPNGRLPRRGSIALDNGFATCEDPAAVQAICHRLGTELAFDPCLRDLGPGLRELSSFRERHPAVVERGLLIRYSRGGRVLRARAVAPFPMWIGSASHPGCSGSRQPIGLCTYRVTARLGGRNGGSTDFIIEP